MNEILLIYLYGIYPNGGLSTIAGIYLTLLFMNLMFIGIDDFNEEKAKEKVKQIWKDTLIYTKIAIAILVIGYFIPSKNIFLAMIATPTIIESLESKTGKLNKIDRLFDKALDELLNEKDKKDNK